MPSDVPERLLLIQLRQLGDVLLTSALLEDLRAAFPASHIDFLTGIKPAELLRGNPFVSDVILHDQDHPLGTPWRVRSRRYRWVIDVQSSPRSAQAVLGSGAHRRVGWGISGPWRLVYTDRVPRTRWPSGYVVRERQRLLEQLDVPVAPRRPRLYLEAAERARGEDDVRSLGTPAGAPRVGLVLSAGAPGNVWPVERYAELATRLAADGVAPVVVRTHGDEDAVARCLALAGGALRADVPELRRFLGFVAALDLLVSADTGPAHMAMALDVPTVTLYGPTHALHWNPGLPTTAAVGSPRARCVGCARGRRRTAGGHTCMLEIDVGPVHARVLELLAATASRRQS